MKITNFILILFLFIIKVSFANTYNSDPKIFVEELVNDAINKLSDKMLLKKKKLYLSKR